MGAGAGGYVQIQLQTLLSEYDPNSKILHRTSRLIFTGAPVPGFEHDRPVLPAAVPPMPGKPPAAKAGLGGLKVADVTAFTLYAQLDDGSFLDMQAKPDPMIASELDTAFGGDWVGYACALAPTGGHFRMIADIAVRNPFPDASPDTKRPFKVIPVVVAFGTDQFANHYLLSVIVAQATTEKVDTAVIQPYA